MHNWDPRLLKLSSGFGNPMIEEVVFPAPEVKGLIFAVRVTVCVGAV